MRLDRGPDVALKIAVVLRLGKIIGDETGVERRPAHKVDSVVRQRDLG